MIKKILLMGILFPFISAAKTPSYFSPAKLANYKTYKLKLETVYFNSIGQFDQEGAELEVNDGSVYTRLDNDLAISYGMGRRFEVSFGGRYRNLTSKKKSNDDPILAAGAESFWGGLRYGFRPVEKWQYTLGVKYRKTAYVNNEIDASTSVDEIELGDAGVAITSALYVDYFRKAGHTLSSYLAYNIPANNMSAEVLYRIETVWIHNSWSFKLGVEGIHSLNAEEVSDVEPRLAINTGYTKQFNSINRSFALPYVGFNIRAGSLLLGIRYGQTMREVSTDKGQHFLFNLEWNSPRKENIHQTKLRAFKEYEIEASVIKISPRGKFIKIDQGLISEVEMGRKFDIYQTDFFGGNKLIAAGIIVEVSPDWAIIKLVKRYRNIPVKKGFTARGY